jgi:hypothetical protein
MKIQVPNPSQIWHHISGFQQQEVHLDEATIRVLRDIANAAVLGIREVQSDCVGNPPPPPASDFDRELRDKLADVKLSRKPDPFDVIAVVCAHIRDALDEHLPEHAEREKRMLAERAAREAAEDAAERAKAAK